jgi:MtrB/PioB family decaheme-associated outer membrane protein
MQRGIRLQAAAFAAALALGAGGAARADDDDQKYHDLTTLESRAEIGFHWGSEDDEEYGDYTGLDQGGFSVLSSFDLRRRSAYDAELPWYVRTRGLNLGLDSRYVDALVEMPGRFAVDFLFDEMPKFQTDSAQTPFRDLGTNFLTLPPGWDPGTNPTPAQMSLLESSLRDLRVSHQRQTYGGGASLVLTDQIDLDGHYRRETKKGNKFSSGMFGLNGGNPRSIVIVEPLDFVTHQIDSNLRFENERVQLQLGYYGSAFENDDHFMQWQDPFTAVGGGGGYDPAAAYPAFGQKAVMPDNWFHQGTASAGINLPWNSRLMLNGAFGWGKQEDDFLPYANPDIPFSTPISLALPRDDLDGKVTTGLGSFLFTSSPLPKLDLSVGYKWTERDNESPVDVYYRVLNDSGAGGANPDQNTDNARINRPYSFRTHEVDADVAYEILPRTKLTLFYEWELTDRNLQEVDESDEHTFGVKLVSRPHPRISGGGRFERAYRDNDGYDCVAPWVESEPPDVLFDPARPVGCNLSVPDVRFENHPDGRKFNMAKRRRTASHLWWRFALLDTLSLGIDARYSHDDYFDSELGLTDYRTFAPGVDLSWVPTEWLSFHLFYEYEETRSKQDSIDNTNTDGDNVNDGEDYPITRGWSGRDKDTFHTAGAGLEVVAIPERLTFSADYLFARSRSQIDMDRNAELVQTVPIFLPFPDDFTELHDVSLRTELHVTRYLSVRLGYLWERLRARDWATDRVCPGCLDFSGNSAVIVSGEDSPEYDAHLGSFSVVLRFR